MDEAEEKLLDGVRKRIFAVMQADWSAYRAAISPTTAPTSQPAAGPASIVGVPYGSAEYLPAVALLVQKEFGFLPPVNRHGKKLADRERT